MLRKCRLIFSWFCFTACFYSICSLPSIYGRTIFYARIRFIDAKKNTFMFKVRGDFKSVVLLQLNRTPLHVATEGGHSSIIEILIDKYKADVNQRSKV